MEKKKATQKTIVKRFELKEREIGADAVGDDVEKVQRYLTHYGYLIGSFELKRLDSHTQQALQKFQECCNIEKTGIVDPDTADALEKPRCGVPDIIPAGRASSGVSADFVRSGCDYQAKLRTLTYAFILGTPDIAGTMEKDPVRTAFTTWQSQIPIDMVEVGIANDPTFTVGWFTGAHGDTSRFDGPGNVLAHAYYPPPCGGIHAGKLHFDDAELWATADAPGQIDTETVALHEIGHLLGLRHSTVAGSVMEAIYAGQRRALSQDDIDGIHAAYGIPGPALDVLVHLAYTADRSFRENEFAGTRGESRDLQGFQIAFSPPVPGLSMRYMAHLAYTGDTSWVNEGQFVGTRGQSRDLQGFAIELTGTNAGNYNVFYMAHLAWSGDTGYCQNGQFCGTRGQSRPVQGILVRVEPR